MLKRFRKLQFLCKKKQEYRSVNFQAKPMVFGWTQKIWKFSGKILPGCFSMKGESNSIKKRHSSAGGFWDWGILGGM